MMRWAVSAVLLLMLAAPAWAGFDEGLAAVKRGDYATALRELRPLAEQGHANAQYNLAAMYAKGLGVAQDYVQAVRWLRNAAEQGYAKAQGTLGNMFYKGRGVAQDYAEAARWYRKAAEQGNAKAQDFFGFLCATGRGVAQDDMEAYKWFVLAGARGNKGRDLIAKRMTPAQIAEAQRLAREWTPKKK